MMCPYNGLLFSSKKEGTIDIHNNMDETHMHYAKWKIPDSKDSILCDSIVMAFWRDKIIRNNNKNKISVCQGVGGGRGRPQRGTGEYWCDQAGVYLDCGGGYPLHLSNFVEPYIKNSEFYSMYIKKIQQIE